MLYCFKIQHFWFSSSKFNNFASFTIIMCRNDQFRENWIIFCRIDKFSVELKISYQIEQFWVKIKIFVPNWNFMANWFFCQIEQFRVKLEPRCKIQNFCVEVNNSSQIWKKNYQNCNFSVLKNEYCQVRLILIYDITK